MSLCCFIIFIVLLLYVLFYDYYCFFSSVETSLLKARLSIEVLVDVLPAEKKPCCSGSSGSSGNSGSSGSASTAAQLKARILAIEENLEQQAPLLTLINMVMK